MKKLLLLLMVYPALFWSCSKDDDSDKKSSGQLIIPQFGTASLTTNNPFTGILLVAPAQGDGSIYYGNYNSKDELSPIHGLYTVAKGGIVHDNIPVKLPVGQYNLVYWGVPLNNSADSTYSDAFVREPSYVIGNDMKNMYYTLKKYAAPDTTYYPSPDFVFCVQPTKIGTDELSATLQRVTAGAKIILKDKNNGPISPNIYAVRVLVGNIANTLNYFTGKASDFTKTISFPLTKSADGKEMSANSTVMVFPSSPNPLITLVVTLYDGREVVYRKALQSTLNAGSRLTLTIGMGEIFDEESTSNGFEVANWDEKTETIYFQAS